jgi:hypothetical protein
MPRMASPTASVPAAIIRYRVSRFTGMLSF